MPIIDMLFLFSILTFLYENVCNFISALTIFCMITLTVMSFIIRNDDSLNDCGLIMKSDPDLDILHRFYSKINKGKYRIIHAFIIAQNMEFKREFVSFIKKSNFDLNINKPTNSDEILSILSEFISNTPKREVKGFIIN